MIAINKSWSNV